MSLSLLRSGDELSATEIEKTREIESPLSDFFYSDAFICSRFAADGHALNSMTRLDMRACGFDAECCMIIASTDFSTSFSLISMQD